MRTPWVAAVLALPVVLGAGACARVDPASSAAAPTVIATVVPDTSSVPTAPVEPAATTSSTVEATPTATTSVARTTPKPTKVVDQRPRNTPVTKRPTGKPGPGNTGVPAGTKLRRHNGGLTVTKAGTVLDALDIHGYVTIAAPNVRITRSIIRGGAEATTGTVGLLTSYKATGLVVEDSEFRPEHPGWRVDGIKGQHMTLRRVDISGSIDGVGVHGDDVTLQSSWIHDLRFYSPYPLQPDNQSHNDGVQVHTGSGLRITGSTIESSHNAAIMISPVATGAVSNARITGNWLDGGGCTVNVAEKSAAIAGLRITGNTFGRGQTFGGCALYVAPKTFATAALTGNRWVDGEPVAARQNG